MQHVINGPNFAVKIETMSLFLEYPPETLTSTRAPTHARTRALKCAHHRPCAQPASDSGRMGKNR